MASGIKTVYAMFNGQKILATYDEAAGLYTVEATAPANSSWSQPNHVYTMELHAEDKASNKASVTSTDPTYGDQLKFRVLEKSKPVAEILSPAEGSVLGANSQNISLSIQDVGDSGINFAAVVFKVNGTAVTIAESDWAAGENGVYTYTYAASGLSDGANKVSLQVQDNDGNTSDEAIVNFIISTAAPTLNVTSPVNNLITNSATVTVAGTSAPGSEFVTLAEVKVNDEVVTVSDDGSFDTTVTLTEGSNTITIVAKDSLGKTTTVIRTVVLDTAAPVITDVVAEALTVDASGTIRVTFKVVDN